MTSLRYQMRYLNPYDLHKLIINEYILNKPGDTTQLLKRDSSKDRTDYDVLKQNHKFLWDGTENTSDSWELQFARKYYDKLFKEYCIGDLSLYKENKIALRWRIEQEVVIGKGQFICGNKRCSEKEALRTWEVNFGYVENGEKKNALVKIRLCPDCSKKLNYHTKKREVKRLKRKRDRTSVEASENERATSSSQPPTVQSPEPAPEISSNEKEPPTTTNTESPWTKLQKPEETKTRDEEMEDYLNDLLF